jgi:hypothetical protein
MLKDETENTWPKNRKGNKKNPSESPKLGLIFQTYNSRNPRPMLN